MKATGEAVTSWGGVEDLKQKEEDIRGLIGQLGRLKRTNILPERTNRGL